MNMKKMVVPVCLFMLIAGSAHAQNDPMGGIGFRSSGLSTGLGLSLSPTLGIRQWFSSQIGGDLGIGFVSISDELNGTTTDETTGFAFDVGLPISLKTWDRVNFILRPGFAYATAKTEDRTLPTPPNEIKATVYSISGELEVEWMLAERVSISAATGIAYNSVKFEDNDTPAAEIETKGFGTIGSNFTQLGFHVYLW